MLRTISCVVVVAIVAVFIPVPASWAGTVLEFVEAEFDGVGGVDGLDAAYGVTVSPDGAHVYAAGRYDDAVAVFERDGLTGALTFVEAEFDGLGGIDGLDGASSVAVSPDGVHIYVAGRSDNAVAVFERDVVTGGLSFVEAQFDGVGGVDGLFSANSVAVSSDGMHVYVAAVLDDSVAVFERDGVTGELTFVEAQFDGVGGVDGLDSAYSVAVSADGAHVYVAGYVDDAVTVFDRNGVTGALTFGETEFDGVDGVDGLNGARSVAVSPDGGNVYVASYYDDAVTVWDRDSVTGALTFVEALFDGVGGVDGLNAASSVAVSADGEHVYVASYYDDTVAVFERDGVTGELTFVEAHFDGIDGVDGLDGPYALAVSPDGGNVYAASWNEDALSVFVRGLLDPDVVADLEAGNEAYFARDFATAEQHFSDVISAVGLWAPGHNNRGLARCKQLDFAGAGADFDMAKSLAPTYVAPYLNQGKCLAMQHDLAGARIEFEAGLAIDPEHVKLLYNLGWVEAEEGHYDNAIARYSEALVEDSTYVRARVAAGVALAEKGESSSAVVAFYDAINTAPTGDLFAAMSAYNLQLLRGPGVSFDSDSATQEYGDGLFNMRVGLFAEAEKDFITAQALEPFLPDIPWMLAWSRLRQLQTDAAADALADALPLMPVLDVDSSEESQLFIDGIFRGNTPQTVEVFPSRVDVALRRAQGPQERTVVAYADGTPGGESPIEVTLEEVSSISPFAEETDSDRDWLGDDWEVFFFANLSQGPWGDVDDDGVSNLREYWANTDPGLILPGIFADGFESGNVSAWSGSVP
jgi:6-phosphogluconolactonase (cycloisomerase 2 family)